MIYVALLFLTNLISAISQLLLKKAALRTYKSFWAEYINLRVIGAYFLFFVSVLLDLTALRHCPVSYLPIIETSSYIFVFILGRIFLQEYFTKRKLIGMAVIITGIIIYLQ